MGDNLKRKNIDMNIGILHNCMDLYDIGFELRWADAIAHVNFVEYSCSDIRNQFGYYSESVWYELAINNYQKGKLFRDLPKNYNYKYYFDKEGKLLITEKYFSEQKLPEVYFHIYDAQKKTVLMYENVDDWIIFGVIHSSFDENERLTHFIRGQISKNRFQYIEEHVYIYDSDEMRINRASYSEASDLLDQNLIWDNSVFPIEWLHGKPKNNYLAMSKEDLKRKLSKKIERILSKLDKKNPYSIMFIFDGPETLSVDYAIESSSNKNKSSEERWNYACWVQHPIPIWNTQNEKKQFISWLENETLDSELGVSLVDNQHFIELFYQIFDDLKGSVSLSNLFQRVTFLVTDFEIHDRIVTINLKLNQTENLKDFLSWINTIEDKMP